MKHPFFYLSFLVCVLQSPTGCYGSEKLATCKNLEGSVSSSEWLILESQEKEDSEIPFSIEKSLRNLSKEVLEIRTTIAEIKEDMQIIKDALTTTLAALSLIAKQSGVLTRTFGTRSPTPTPETHKKANPFNATNEWPQTLYGQTSTNPFSSVGNQQKYP